MIDGLVAGRAVGVVERPAAPKLHADRLEEPRTDGDDADLGRALFRLARGTPLDVDAAASAAEGWHARRERHRLDAGNRLEPGQQAIVEGDARIIL